MLCSHVRIKGSLPPPAGEGQDGGTILAIHPILLRVRRQSPRTPDYSKIERLDTLQHLFAHRGGHHTQLGSGADRHRVQSPALLQGTQSPPHIRELEPGGESENQPTAFAADAARASARRPWLDCEAYWHGPASAYLAIAAPSPTLPRLRKGGSHTASCPTLITRL